MKLCGWGQHSVFLARKSGHIAGVAAAAAVSMAAAAVRLATSETVIAEKRCIVGDMLLLSMLMLWMVMLWGKTSKARKVGFGSHASVVTEDGEREETWNIVLTYCIHAQRTCVPTSWMLVARNVQDIYLYAHKHLSGQ